MDREKDFLEKLRGRPELMERFAAILELTQCAGGELRSADAVEEAEASVEKLSALVPITTPALRPLSE